MSVIGIQRRMMELGRVRLGEKGSKGEPRKLDHFRFTSASRALLDAVAAAYGGTVSEWKEGPDEGLHQVTTDAKELPIILPPVFSAVDGSQTTSYSQFYELWSGAGCERRCDGQTEALSGKPCMCTPDDRACDITTRLSFMLPDIPGLGVWRLDSKGWNAAVELPGTLEVLMMAAAQQSFIPAVLRIEHRTKKTPGGPVRRFVVPVIDLPGVTMNQLAAGDVPLAINAPTPRPARAALPVGPPPPVDAAFEQAADSPFGAPPALPETGPLVQGSPIDDENTQRGAIAVGTGERAGELVDLANRLLDLSHELGKKNWTVAQAIQKNRDDHADQPHLHEKWLRRQIKMAEEALAEKAPA